ncbi:M48 family metallopeptidase [Sphingomonas sp. ac-8]|uniref:M48 family metallopeptidase n=1 Tax=Sphingomonas sp. ac-8 TaxID=3242977 RepID=UPI003A81085F
MSEPTGAPIEVVRHARARRARLSVDPATGRVRLVLPPRAALRPALAWAESKRAWIDAQQSRLPEARPFVPDATIPFGDTTLRIDWTERGARTPMRDGERLCCGGPVERVPVRVERWLRGEALARLSEATQRYAARAGVHVSQVAIGDPRGRWGSCTASGAIRYSWRLILAPRFVLEATAAHEVAHRLHMDHSPAFHAAVRRLLDSDPAPARAWLRAHGAALHWYGRPSGS